MDQNAPDARQRVVNEMLESAASSGPRHSLANLEAFLVQYYRNIPLSDLKARKPVDLAGAALGHLTFGASREPGETLARIFNPSSEEDGWDCSHTIVEVVTDDMPFLVDSLGMVINRHDLYIHLTVHPVLTVRGESTE